MKIDVLTLFPEMFRPVMGSSMLGRAVAAGILQIKATDIRQFSHDKHNKADDYPFGGGGGMVMMADPVFGAMESVEAENKKVIYMSPRGKILDREKIEELSKIPEMVLPWNSIFTAFSNSGISSSLNLISITGPII